MQLTGKARLAGIMGWPVGHSRSPRLHGHWFARYGSTAPTCRCRCSRRISSWRFGRCRGSAFAAGTSRCRTRRRPAGWSTSWTRRGADRRRQHGAGARGRAHAGAEHATVWALSPICASRRPDWRPEPGRRCCSAPAGGPRRSAVALLDAGVPALRLANRSTVRAAAWPMNSPRSARWPRALGRARRRAGRRGAAGELHQPRHGGPAAARSVAGRPADPAVVADLVYVPLETPLLAAARARGHVAVDGLGMLLHQAVPGFAIGAGWRPRSTTSCARPCWPRARGAAPLGP